MNRPGGHAPRADPRAGGPASKDLGRLILRNVILNFAGRAVSMGGWMILTPYLLARLGVERFGFWSLISTLAGLTLTVDLGLSAALTKYVAELTAADDRPALRGAFTLSLLIYIGLGLVWIAAVAVFRDALLDFARVAPALREESRAALLVASGAFACSLVGAVCSAVLTGVHRLDLVNRISVAVTLAQLLGSYSVLIAGGGLLGVVQVSCGAAALGAAISWLAMRRVAPAVRFDARSPSRGLGLSLGRFSAALQIINLGVLAQYQLPKLLFARFLSLASVASFELGYRVAFAAWSVPSLLLTPLLPAVSHIDALGDRARVHRLYRLASRYVLTAAFAIAAALAALSGPLYTLWLGPGHSEAALAHLALITLLGVNVLTSAGCIVARGLGRPWIEARYQMLSFTLQLLLGIWWVPRLGFRGGLLAMLTSGFVGTAYFVWAFHRAFGESIASYFTSVVMRPLLSAVAAGLAAWIASGAPWSNPASWHRGPAAVSVLEGGATFALVWCLAVFTSHSLKITELRDMARLLVSPSAASLGDEV